MARTPCRGAEQGLGGAIRPAGHRRWRHRSRDPGPRRGHRRGAGPDRGLLAGARPGDRPGHAGHPPVWRRAGRSCLSQYLGFSYLPGPDYAGIGPGAGSARGPDTEGDRHDGRSRPGLRRARLAQLPALLCELPLAGQRFAAQPALSHPLEPVPVDVRPFPGHRHLLPDAPDRRAGGRGGGPPLSDPAALAGLAPGGGHRWAVDSGAGAATGPRPDRWPVEGPCRAFAAAGGILRPAPGAYRTPAPGYSLDLPGPRRAHRLGVGPPVCRPAQAARDRRGRPS